jgi:ribose/xylose/arabinose/galactoside ABC-type transport system permease subunit
MNANFMTVKNITTILTQVSINGILSVGAMCVMLTGGIDLSIGSIVAFAGVVVASFAQTASGNTSVAPALMMGMLVGIGFGMVNGVLVSRFNIVPFIATLATMSIVRGIAFIFAKGRPITGLMPEFTNIGSGKIGIISYPVIILLIIFLIAYIVLYRLKVGRFIYAVGGNEYAAKVSGVNVQNVKLLAYSISGALAGLTAIILTARVTSGLPQAGDGYEMDAIAACAIGGTSLSGGRGKLWAVIIGIVLLGVISNGMDMLKITSYWQSIIKGLIILLAVGIDARKKD